jgi:hypothetical protein
MDDGNGCYFLRRSYKMKCPQCGKMVQIIPYGDGYIATCCGKIIYNAKTLPEASDAKS